MVWKIVVLIPDKLKKKLKTVKEAILKWKEALNLPKKILDKLYREFVNYHGVFFLNQCSIS
jgi:hypothetical protein